MWSNASRFTHPTTNIMNRMAGRRRRKIDSYPSRTMKATANMIFCLDHIWSCASGPCPCRTNIPTAKYNSNPVGRHSHDRPYTCVPVGVTETLTPPHNRNALRRLSERTFSAVCPADENQQRGNWDNPIEFFLSCLGYAVGLGNVWRWVVVHSSSGCHGYLFCRFPYLCFRSGGGAFFIPYGIMLCCCALPILFAELIIGQYASQGPLTIWGMAPAFKGLYGPTNTQQLVGVGISMLVVSFICAIYYNMISGWAIYYAFLSLRNKLPWTCCEGMSIRRSTPPLLFTEPWASPGCVSSAPNGTCPSRDVDLSRPKMASDDYFHNHVLNISDGQCSVTS
jgi:hypothetical protein